MSTLTVKEANKILKEHGFKISTDLAKEVLRDAGYITGSLWQLDDIQMTAEDRYDTELTQEQLENIRNRIERSHDAEVGINWDVIAYYVGEELGE